MFKKFLGIAVISLTIFLVVAQPSYAMTTAPATAGNFFQQLANSFSNTVQQLYLRWIPGDKSGSAVLNQALLSTQQLKTVQVTADVTANLFHDTQQQATLHLNVKGPVQLQPQPGSSANQDLQVAGDFSMQGTTLNTAAELKVTGDTMYFKLDEVPTLPNVNLSSITGKWYKTANTTASESATLSDASKQQLNQAFVQLWQAATVGTAHPDTKDGRAVYVVTATLPRAALEEYMNTVIAIQSQTRPDQVPGITNTIQTGMQKNLDKIGDVKTEIWVDKSTFNVIHLESNIQYLLDKPTTPAHLTTGPLAALAQINQVNLLVQFDFSNFNQPIQFTEPIDAQDASGLFTNAVGQILNAGNASSVGTSELPNLTPEEQLQLEQLNSISPAQKENFLKQLDNMQLSTQSGTQP